MFVVLRRSNTLFRRCARDLLYANILQLPRRQQIFAENSFQTHHYSSSASIPKERHTWTSDEVRNLVEHVKSEYRSRKRRISWKKVSELFGLSPHACKVKYYNSHKIDFKKEDAEAAKKDGNESKCIVKAVFDRAIKIASLRDIWTTDDVARLREARGDRNKKCVKGSWARIAEYVGAGKTAEQCRFKWKRLCSADDRKAWLDNQNNATAANGPTNRTTHCAAGWTPEELLQLKALFDTPSDRKNPRLHIAYALFPQKPQTQVRCTMNRLNDSMAKQKLKMLESESRPLLRKLVSDFGGAEKADWEAISKEIGLTASQCQKAYHRMTVAVPSLMAWTPDELDRLLANLRSQNADASAYDWDLAAAAVGTRSSVQCCARFFRHQRSKEQ